MKILSLSIAALFAASTAVSAQDAGALKPASAGVYKEEQAARGDTVFQRTCLSCHTPSFHADDQFKMNWIGRTVYDLFKLLKTLRSDQQAPTREQMLALYPALAGWLEALPPEAGLH